jgi:hypothetical protein
VDGAKPFIIDRCIHALLLSCYSDFLTMVILPRITTYHSFVRIPGIVVDVTHLYSRASIFQIVPGACKTSTLFSSPDTNDRLRGLVSEVKRATVISTYC